MVMNRREFLAGMTAVTAAALCGPGAVLAPGPCDPCLLDGYLRPKGTGQLSISFLGTFAIFVFKDHIDAYTPSVLDKNGNPLHNYWFAIPTGRQGLDSDRIFDLQSPNTFGGIDNHDGTLGTIPTFTPCSPRQPNNIDNVVNMVVDAQPPTPGKYLHKISLPLPDDIVLAGWSEKNTNPIFAKQRDFCHIARDHRFLYNAGRVNTNKLTFNGAPVAPGLDFRFVSEPHPQDENEMAQECQSRDHIERAMTALARMLGKGDDEYKVNTEYCNQQQVPPSATIASARDARRDRAGVALRAGLDGGGGVQIASRLPACQSVIINATGP